MLLNWRGLLENAAGAGGNVFNVAGEAPRQG